jgi:osmotically-inducible protein OsmY
MKMISQRLVLLSLSAAALAASLSACVPLVVGGAAAGGVLVAIDRRTSGAQLEDEGIEMRANSRLKEAMGDSAHINVTSFNRQVLLTGEVPSAQDQKRAEEVVARVDNVRTVVNDLAVGFPSSLSQRSSDVLITGKVKASLIDAKDVQLNAFKVITERGAVYLMGRVTQREADRATQIARGVSGVTKVVRVFEILSEEELARLNRQGPTPQQEAAKP